MQGIIFDFNGTLFDDSKKHEEAWLKFAKEKAGRQLTSEDFEQLIHGRNNADIIRYLFQQDFTAAEALKLAEEKEEMYRQACLQDPACFHLIAGAEGFFEELKNHRIPMMIATAAGKNNVDFYFEHLGLGRWFEREKIVFEDGSFKGKPAPDIYLKALAALHLAADQVTVFEDSRSGITAARKAGIKTVIGVVAPGRPGQLADVDLEITDFKGAELKRRFLSREERK